jgi:hypothetical protein
MYLCDTKNVRVIGHTPHNRDNSTITIKRSSGIRAMSFASKRARGTNYCWHTAWPCPHYRAWLCSHRGIPIDAHTCSRDHAERTRDAYFFWLVKCVPVLHLVGAAKSISESFIVRDISWNGSKWFRQTLSQTWRIVFIKTCILRDSISRRTRSARNGIDLGVTRRTSQNILILIQTNNNLCAHLFILLSNCMNASYYYIYFYYILLYIYRNNI